MRLVEKAFLRSFLFGAMVITMTMHSESARAQQASAAGQNDVTAIDILLDPDAMMIQHATAANASSRVTPRASRWAECMHRTSPCCSGSSKQRPPQSVRSCRQSDRQGESNQFQAYGYKYDHIGEAKIGDDVVGVGNILVKPTPELLKLQQELADAIKPFEASTGTSAAFVTTPQAPHISEDLIHYVSVFVPDHSGDH
jgi:hypothetical protein